MKEHQAIVKKCTNIRLLPLDVYIKSARSGLTSRQERSVLPFDETERAGYFPIFRTVKVQVGAWPRRIFFRKLLEEKPEVMMNEVIVVEPKI